MYATSARPQTEDEKAEQAASGHADEASTRFRRCPALVMLAYRKLLFLPSHSFPPWASLA